MNKKDNEEENREKALAYHRNMIDALSKVRGAQGKELKRIKSLVSEKQDKYEKHLTRDQKINVKMLLENIKMIIELKENTSTKASGKIAKLDFHITDSNLTYKVDLDQFHQKIMNLFTEFYGNDNNKTTKQDGCDLMAPYFPLIQSSGMGKTKLMYEERDDLNKKGDYHCVFILCTDGKTEEKENSIYDKFMDLNAWNAPSNEARDEVCTYLDDIRKEAKNEQNKNKSLVLFFDESQHLTGPMDGWYFRVVRWWLRRRTHEKRIVAVFAGTTAKLANFYHEEKKATNSRNIDSGHDETGTRLVPPFCEITTIGLGVLTRMAKTKTDTQNKNDNDQSNEASKVTEYDISIPYGRPLFHFLQQDNQLDEGRHSAILKRMLVPSSNKNLGWEKWYTTDNVCFSILGTRVQMGQVSFNLASDVVALGYANLVHMSTNESSKSFAEITFMRDPVCARLAMCMMLENSNLSKALLGEDDASRTWGKGPKWWSEKARGLFSDGLCRPDKGDLGEIAAALLMIYCGDEIRAKNDDSLKRFSIPFRDWIWRMENNTIEDVEKKGDDTTPEGNKKEDVIAEINFIQVCRNYLRDHGRYLRDQNLLKLMYKSGQASYMYGGCTAFNILAPIRIKKENVHGSSSGKVGAEEYDYCPMIVSVKNCMALSKGQRKNAMDDMVKEFERAGAENGVAILLFVGLTDDLMVLLDKHRNTSCSFKGKGISCFEIIVGKTVTTEENNITFVDDVFGVYQLASCPTIRGGERSELYCSHAHVSDIVIAETTMAKTKNEHSNDNDSSQEMNTKNKNEDDGRLLRKSAPVAITNFLGHITRGYKQVISPNQEDGKDDEEKEGNEQNDREDDDEQLQQPQPTRRGEKRRRQKKATKRRQQRRNRR